MDKVYKVEKRTVESMCDKYVEIYFVCEDIFDYAQDKDALDDDGKYQYWCGVLAGIKECLESLGVSVDCNYINDRIETRRNEQE